MRLSLDSVISGLNRRLGPTITALLAQIVWGASRILSFRYRAAKVNVGVGAFEGTTFHKLALQSLCRNFDKAFLPEKASRPALSTRLAGAVLRLLQLRFIVNVAPGMGHNTVELDRAFRMMKSGQITGRVALLRRPSPIHRDTLDLYRNWFWFASDSNFLFDWLFPAVARYPKLRIDLGLSRLKWHLRDDCTHDELPSDGQTYLQQVSKEENRLAWQEYYALRRQTKDDHPLAEGLEPDAELLEFLGGRPRKLALVHLKYHVANATATASDPGSYLDAIDWLHDQGYLVVQVGREYRPEAFRERGVLNYAQSSIASYKHDLQIFSIASLAITAGSGIAFMPDCMGIPLVYLDSWHLGMPLASSRCVMVPALVEEVDTGQRLTFRDQFALYWSLEDSGDETFPIDRYRARNAERDEVLAAVKEALALRADEQPLTPYQRAYRDIEGNGLSALALARTSHYFLEKHAILLIAQPVKKAADGS